MGQPPGPWPIAPGALALGGPGGDRTTSPGSRPAPCMLHPSLSRRARGFIAPERGGGRGRKPGEGRWKVSPPHSASPQKASIAPTGAFTLTRAFTPRAGKELAGASYFIPSQVRGVSRTSLRRRRCSARRPCLATPCRPRGRGPPGPAAPPLGGLIGGGARPVSVQREEAPATVPHADGGPASPRTQGRP